MAFPASRFIPVSSPLDLRIPAQLTASTGQPKPPPPAPGPLPALSLPVEAVPARGDAGGAGQPAVEVDRVVPASGDVQLLSQWLARDPARLGDSLAQFVGHPAYGLAQLRGDLQRFIFLLGGSDGAALFGPDTAQ
jgi:hypothetical protein